MFFRILFILTVFFTTASKASDWPKEIPRCRAGNTTCVVEVANYFVRTFKDGNKALGIPRFEPYLYNETVSISPSSSGSIQVHLSGSNNILEGLSDQNFEKAVGFTGDIKTSKFEFYGRLNKLVLRGDYRAKAKLFFSMMDGNGTYVVVMEDIKGSIKFKPKVTKVENGKTYMKVDKLRVRLVPKTIKMNFSDFFNGNEVVGEAITNLINENIDLVWEELAPETFKAAEQIMTNVIDKAIAVYAFEDLYLKD